MFKTKEDVMEFAKKYSAIILMAILLVYNIIFTPNFFQFSNLTNVIEQICPTVLCGMGMTLVISTGGIDIAVGSIMAVACVINALVMQSTGIIPAVIGAVIVSTLIGCFTGTMVGKLKLQAMVVTLGLQLGLRGLAQVLCGGYDIYYNNLGEVGAQMSLWGSTKIFGVPVQIVPILIAVIFTWVLTEKTVLGRQIQAVGDNSKSSSLVGINTAKTMMIVYGLSGAFAGVAGIFAAARTGVAAGSSLGQAAELDAIAATVIGGTPMSGGKAHVIGTVIGALIMQLITLTCVMNNIPTQYAQVLKAIIIVVAVYIQRERAK